MTERRCCSFHLRHAAVFLPLFLAACAGTQRPAVRFAPAPATYFTVQVKPGDSLSKLAQAYQVEEDDLLALNDIRASNRLIAGSGLRVPAYGRLRDEWREQPVLAARAPTSRVDIAPVQPPTPSRVASAVPIPRPKPGQAAPEPAQSSWLDFDWLNFAPPEIPDGAKFLWPVEGRVISAFGSSASGERNDGINILTPRGTPVRAAAAGNVTYVGNELKGYGNLVLIRHDNGYVTAYAHSEKVAANRGERVARGQVIAYTGATGNVTEPQLHFELRVGTKPVDPKLYLVTANVASN